MYLIIFVYRADDFNLTRTHVYFFVLVVCVAVGHLVHPRIIFPTGI